MKKVICMAVIAALCVSAPAFAQTTINLRIVEAGTGLAAVEADTGDQIFVEIIGNLTGDVNDGLALWGANLTGDGGTYAADLCSNGVFGIDIPGADPMQQFARNRGLTNPGPGGPADTTGYAGTCDGAGGLWQVGGGMNTIGNTDPPVYPVGDVIFQIANAGDQVLATGSIVVPDDAAPGDTIALDLDSAFANAIVDGEDGGASPYAVYQVELNTVAGMVITVEAPDPYACPGGLTPHPECPNEDVNCDCQVTGLDVAIVKSTANWQLSTGAAANIRADVNRDTNVTGLDVAAIKSTACWQVPPVAACP